MKGDIDFTYMSLGGGVQSGTMTEMIVEGDLSKPDLVVFADTGDEPQYVYDYIEYLRERLNGVNVPLSVVSAGNLIDDLTAGKGRFAAIPAFTVNRGKKGRLKRQCTSDYKITPIESEVRRWLLERGLAGTGGKRIRVNTSTQVEAWLGISTDEALRMKPSQTKWVTNRWPLIEQRMSRRDCVQYLLEKKLPVPQKSSCRICPYHNDSYWRNMQVNSPDDWNFVVDFDNGLRDSRAGRFASTATGELFLHKNCIPLASVDLRTQEERGQMRIFEDETDMCDSGYCFV